MLDRFGLWTTLAVAGTVLTAALAVVPAAAAASVSASAAAPVSAAAAPVSASAAASVSPAAIGGAQLSGRGVIVNYPPGSVRRLPGVRASAFVIADAGTGQVLAARDPHGWYRPASTLKVLTAIALIPVLNPDATVVATKQATTVVPNVVGLIPGHAYQIAGLFTALLTISANDAAVALTQATGSFGRGMALINAEARHLRADDTVAVQPNGLDGPGQRTSAYDLALIARQALKMPAFLKYDQAITAKFQVSAKKQVTLYNQNGLLTSYPGAVGGKIGWTSAAGATYLGIARRNGVTLIVTLLHCPALTEVDSAKSLLNWGFAVDGKVRPVGTLVSALSPSAPAPAQSVRAQSVPPRSVAAVQSAAGRSHSVASGLSVLAAAGFSCVALLAAGIGFAYSRRRRPAARYPRQRD
ncbi:MAG TPA: D-alanyl-D-alanine carboxypeptidase [Streptosporangiaceae bacterium]